jgi:8-oxo-dGTP diphosphatase
VDQKQYVIGFLYNVRKGRVVLITKNRPDWQKGKLNGVGGHVEQGETNYEAMVREFNEEAGIKIRAWQQFATVNYPDSQLHCFRAFGDFIITTKTDEVVKWYPLDKLPENLIPNLRWIIPMGLYDDKYLTGVEYVTG